MKLKLWILVLLSACLFLLLANQSHSTITYASLAKQLKYRLAESSPDFSDADLQLCIVMGKIAVIAHSLSHKESYKIYLPVGDQYITLNPPAGNSFDIMFVTGVTKYTGGPGDERSLSEVKLKDLGHKQIQTDSPLSYFCFFRDTITTYIYVFPASADIESLRIELVYAGFGDPGFYVTSTFIESILDFALFIAYLRMENYTAAARAYNAYKAELALLREETVNRKYDVTLAPKLIK